VVRESPELCIAGVYGVRLQVRPNVNGKVEVGLLVPRGALVRFSVVVSWGSEDERSQDLRMKEQGRFEGMHFFQGGWIRESVAFSSALQNALSLITAVTFYSVEWTEKAALLANQLELFQAQRMLERREEKRKFETLKVAAEKEIAAKVAAVSKLEALLATRDGLHEAEVQALRHEITRLRLVHEAELQDLRAEVSRLRGEDPSLQQLDTSKLEELLTVVSGTQERAWKRLKRMHVQERLCALCGKCDADAVINSCGHLVTCSHCAERLAFCPACKRPSSGFTRSFS